MKAWKTWRKVEEKRGRKREKRELLKKNVKGNFVENKELWFMALGDQHPSTSPTNIST